ncbi:MAG: PEGA domain-containing protein [Chitinivibrionales bacterium]|nr:PEGA domain-containing protein [Chitinivibrionales bacterium]
MNRLVSLFLLLLISLTAYAQEATETESAPKPVKAVEKAVSDDEKGVAQQEKTADKITEKADLESDDQKEGEQTQSEPPKEEVGESTEEKTGTPKETEAAKETESEAETAQKGQDTNAMETPSEENSEKSAADDTAQVKTGSTQQKDSIETTEAKQETAKGALKITTDPDDALLLVDGESVGKTPITVENLAPGKHTLEIRKAGHYLKKATVTVAANSVQELPFTLLKPATLVVLSEPSEAAVTINNKAIGITPLTKGKLKPGEYVVKIRKTGFAQQTKKISLSSGEVDTLDFSLKALEKKTAAAPEEKKPSGESEKSKIARIIVLSAFALFGVGIFIAELAGR